MVLVRSTPQETSLHMDSRHGPSSTTDIPIRSSSPRQYRLNFPHLPDPSSHASSSSPMSIPRSSRGASPPPPLPPPKEIHGLSQGNDHAWRFANQQREGSYQSDISSSLSPGSSLLGGQFRPSRPPERKVDLSPRDYPLSSFPHQSSSRSSLRREDSDGGPLGPDNRIPDLAALLEYNKLAGERQLSQRERKDAREAYDKTLLQRIGGPGGTSPRSAGSLSSHFGNEDTQPFNHHSAPSSLRLLTLPERRHSSNEVDRPPLSTSHPSTLSPGVANLRSPLSDDGFERSHHHYQNRPFSQQTSHALDEPSFHQDARDDHTTGMTDDYLNDSPSQRDRQRNDEVTGDFRYMHKAGQKRRALSPPPEGPSDGRVGSSHGPVDWSSRQLGITGRPPHAARLQTHTGSFASSVSSAPGSSFAPSQNNSLSTTATSYASEALSSPNYPEPPGYMSSGFSHSQHHQHTSSQDEPMPPPIGHIKAPSLGQRRTSSNGVQRAPGLWICDCCPKKPRKFETEEDLRLHGNEKLHRCTYCHNRFKNKNEMERHQNSLHLRRHSWSCAALTNFEMAFHQTPHSNIPVAQPGQPQPVYPPAPATDTCGYCGMEFPNPPNWDERLNHLNHVHKFGECNQSKKFFRADHFRQHLKHSHAGTPGKWTNMLETACMKDEPLPQPIDHSQR